MTDNGFKRDELKQKVIFILQGWAKYNLQPVQSVRRASIYIQISDKSISMVEAFKSFCCSEWQYWAEKFNLLSGTN